MKAFNCKKCNSADVYIQESGNQKGLYCGDCGKWIQWLGKEDLRLAERFIENNKVCDKCRYCDRHKMGISGDCIMDTDINTTPIKIDILSERSLHINLNGIGATSEIYYCPMCGRKLTNQ